MLSATNRCAALMVFIIGIIIFMTVGKMEGDPAILTVVMLWTEKTYSRL